MEPEALGAMDQTNGTMHAHCTPTPTPTHWRKNETWPLHTNGVNYFYVFSLKRHHLISVLELIDFLILILIFVSLS